MEDCSAGLHWRACKQVTERMDLQCERIQLEWWCSSEDELLTFGEVINKSVGNTGTPEHEIIAAAASACVVSTRPSLAEGSYTERLFHRLLCWSCLQKGQTVYACAMWGCVSGP